MVHIKLMLPASEQCHVGFPYNVENIRVTITLKHDSLDNLQHSNYVLVALDGFIVDPLPPPQMAVKLSVHFLCRTVNALLRFSSSIYSL